MIGSFNNPRFASPDDEDDDDDWDDEPDSEYDSEYFDEYGEVEDAYKTAFYRLWQETAAREYEF